MAEARTVHVKLTADVSDYVRAIKKAKRATFWLYWRNSGVIPVVITSFLLGAFAGAGPFLI